MAKTALHEIPLTRQYHISVQYSTEHLSSSVRRKTPLMTSVDSSPKIPTASNSPNAEIEATNMDTTLYSLPAVFEKWEPPPGVDELNTVCASGQLDAAQGIVLQWLAKQSSIEETTRLDGCFAPALATAVVNDHHLVAAYLLSVGLPLNIQLVERAVHMKSYLMLETFLDHGWDINQPLGRVTPPALMLAFVDEDLKKWFLDRGANPDAPCGWDCTPLSMAVLRESFSVIRLLFEHGGSTKHGQLLHYAAAREAQDRLDVIEFLLEMEAPLDEVMYQHVPDNYYEQAAFGLGTPLHKAAELGRVDAVQLFLNKGANTAIKDSRGYTPAELSERKGYHQLGKLLRSSRPARM